MPAWIPVKNSSCTGRGTCAAMMPEKEMDHFREQLPAEFLADASEGSESSKGNTQQLDSCFTTFEPPYASATEPIMKKPSGRRSAGDLQWTYWA